MQINEVIKQVDLSKHAIKYYEKVGLLGVPKEKMDTGYDMQYMMKLYLAIKR